MRSLNPFRSYFVLCFCAVVFILLQHGLIAADQNHGFLTEYEIISKAINVAGKKITTVVMNVKIYSDPDVDLSSYKTYSIDYTNKENRLLEKELFKMVETVMTRGDNVSRLVRSDENPDILITMDFYTGKKEQYVPPKTVLTTRVQHVWSSGLFDWGHITPVPITQSHTTAGYTKVSYYRNIRLNFLDFKQLSSGEDLEVPPLIWIGEVDSEGSFSDIREVAPILLDQLLNEYPEKSGRPMNQRKVNNTSYGSIGIGVDPKDNRIVKFIDPGSPAADAGLRIGDKLLSFTNYKRYPKVEKDLLGLRKYKGASLIWYTSGYFWNIIMNTGPVQVELKIKRPGVKAPIFVKLTPVVKEYQWY